MKLDDLGRLSQDIINAVPETAPGETVHSDRSVSFVVAVRHEDTKYSVKTDRFEELANEPSLPQVLDNFSLSVSCGWREPQRWSVELSVSKYGAHLEVEADNHDWIDAIEGKVRRALENNQNGWGYKFVSKHSWLAGILVLIPLFTVAIGVLLRLSALNWVEWRAAASVAVLIAMSTPLVGMGLGEKWLDWPPWRIVTRGQVPKGIAKSFGLGLLAGIVANVMFWLVVQFV